jgi:hypothetical protein
VTGALPSFEQWIPAMAAHIQRAIPGCEVHLHSCGEASGHGSRARGSAGPDSDIHLLITAPDDWMEHHHRFQVLGELWGELAQPWDRPCLPGGSAARWCSLRPAHLIEHIKGIVRQALT